MIDIALASDANYACGLLVTAVSIARHASPSAMLRFNVLDGGMTDAIWENLTEHVRTVHAASQFRRFKVDDACFAAYPAWSGTGRMTYARLLLPQVISDADFVVYCDVDFLWMADIAELWRSCDPRIIVQSTCEGKEPTRRLEEPWFAVHGLDYSFERYFCAGLVLFNLKLCRELRVFEKVLAFLDAHPDVQVVDQTALNAVLGGEPLGEDVMNARLLPSRWQLFSGDVTDESLAVGCVIHYAGTAPWRLAHRRVLLSDALLLWHRENGRIRGCGVWASLRSFFPIHRIVVRRCLFLLFATRGVRSLVWPLLRLSGHAACAETFRRECRRLRVDAGMEENP